MLQILGILKIQLLKFEDLKTALFCHFLPQISEDLKTAYLEFEDSKHAFTCWQPQVTALIEETAPHSEQF